MASTAVSARAPGKVILLGEHAVVYGQAAIAAPVAARWCEATVRPDGRGHGVVIEAPQLKAVWDASRADASPIAPLGEAALACLTRWGAEGMALGVRIESNIPPASGMGSGAAAAVALVRALARALGRTPQVEEVVDLAMVAERRFHGNPSGVDVQVVARRAPIWFTRAAGPEPLRPVRAAFHFVAADTGVPSPTGAVVREVSEAREREPARHGALFARIGGLVAAGRAALEAGGPEDLGPLMDRCHEALREVGVSCSEIERLVAAARAAGALGAKLSGAGRGGHVLALARSPKHAAEVAAACRAAGARDDCIFDLVPGPMEARKP